MDVDMELTGNEPVYTPPTEEDPPVSRDYKDNKPHQFTQIFDCIRACQNDDKCHFWVLRKEGDKANCLLKGATAITHRIRKENSFFGPKVCWHSKQSYIYI